MIDPEAVMEQRARVYREEQQLHAAEMEVAALPVDVDPLVRGKAELVLALCQGALGGAHRRLADLERGWEPAIPDAEDEILQEAA